jgi:2-keto-3-deoxy-L-rhamnonate aldolase RhmA
MIESRKGIHNLDKILAVDGLDCIMIGPDDLSQDLGVPGDLKAKILHDAYEYVFSLCAKHGVNYGLSAQSPEMAAGWFAKGCRWIPYQNDAAMVFNTASAVVPKLRELAGR